jgi:hypothetical protein
MTKNEGSEVVRLKKMFQIQKAGKKERTGKQ